MRLKICFGILAMTAVLNSSAFAGEGLEEPTPVSSWDGDPADIFGKAYPKNYFTNQYSGKVALCSICNKPYSIHMGDYECLPPHASSQKLAEVTVECPVCTHEFIAPLDEKKLVSAMDSDFCVYRPRSFSKISDVWICTCCGYAAFAKNFANSKPSPATKQFVLDTIKPLTIKYLAKSENLNLSKLGIKDFGFLGQRNIPEHVRYENAAIIAVKAGSEFSELAALHLGTSHAYRRKLLEPLDISLFTAAIKRVASMIRVNFVGDGDLVVNELKAALKVAERAKSANALRSERLSRRELFYLTFRMTMLYNQLGEAWNTTSYFEDLNEMALSEANPKLKTTMQFIIRNTLAFLRAEMKHRQQTILLLRKRLKENQLEDYELLSTVYLLGELNRRMGRLEVALPYLQVTNALTKNIELKGLARNIAEWNSAHLSDSVFYMTDGEGKKRLIAPDVTESALTGTILERLNLTMDDTVNVPVAQNKNEGKAIDKASGQAGLAITEVSPRAQFTCKVHLEKIFKAIMQFRDNTGSYPNSLDELVSSEVLSKVDAREFICVRSGHKLFYRKPRTSSKEFMIFHNNPMTCSCKYILYSDGSIEERK